MHRPGGSLLGEVRYVVAAVTVLGLRSWGRRGSDFCSASAPMTVYNLVFEVSQAAGFS